MKLIFTPHAGRRVKERRIPREAVRMVAQYGHIVHVARIGQRTDVIKRGNVGTRPLHVILRGNKIVTAYWATKWKCSVRLKKKK